MEIKIIKMCKEYQLKDNKTYKAKRGRESFWRMILRQEK
jgi:hypothetical protein